MKECSLITILLLAFTLVRGQLDFNIPPSQLKSFGDQAMNQGDYYTASDYYLKYCSIKPKDGEAMFHLADAYRKSRDYAHAKEWYLKTYQLDAQKYSGSLFYYALMLKMLSNYEGAKEHFQRFLDEHEHKGDPELIKRSSIEIGGCVLAMEVDKEMAKEQVNVEHIKSNVNGPHIEMSPTFVDSNSILYASFPEDSIRYYDHVDSITKRRRFFIASHNDSIWVQEDLETYSIFNDPKQHVGNGSFSEDKKRFYFTKCTLTIKGTYDCKLYFSRKSSNGWLEPMLLPNNINKANATVTQPSIQTIDSIYDVVYFASDRAGTKGGYDIWFAKYNFKENTSSEVVNLGRNINTEYDEITPFYHAKSGNLYFSSRGWENYGGFDVFKSKGAFTQWILPENMGYPINGSMDDQYFVLSEDEHQGFLTSNRLGTKPFKSEHCCDDLFELKKKDEEYITYMGKLYNSGAIDRILDMEDDIQRIEMLEDETNFVKSSEGVFLYQYLGNDQPVKVDSTVSNSKGEFEFQLKKNKHYKIVVESEGFFNKHQRINTSNLEDGNLESHHIGMLELTTDPIIIRNIYYPFDEWYLTKEAKHRIDTTVYRILEENPKLIIELSSHTDNFGTENYNDKLSQRRAESVVEYLIKKGIDKNRLRAKGYGERRPIAPNSYSDGSDNPEGRQRNRRTEFRVIGMIKGGKEIIYEE